MSTSSRQPPLHPWGPMPYAGITDPIRCALDVSKADLHYLKTVCPHYGFITYLIQSSVKSAADYARANKLTYGDEPRLLAYLAERFRYDAGSPAAKDTTPRTGRSRAKKLHPNNAGGED